MSLGPPTDSPSREQRFSGRDFGALIAADTFDPVIERIKAIVSSGRRMVLISRYASLRDRDPTARHNDISVGLRLRRVEVTASHLGGDRYRHFAVHLDPGFLGFGFSADHRDEKTVRRAFESRHEPLTGRPGLTDVFVDGWADNPERTDRIDIRHWNEFGVCRMTSLVFQADWG